VAERHGRLRAISSEPDRSCGLACTRRRTTREVLIELLTSTFDVDAGSAAANLDELLSTLRERRLLEPSEGVRGVRPSAADECRLAKVPQAEVDRANRVNGCELQDGDNRQGSTRPARHSRVAD
jgi:hypothetical protein